MEPYKVLLTVEPNSKNVKINKHLIKLSLKFIGKNKSFISLSQFADQAFRTQLQQLGVKL
jgi:hypothetical protein